MGKTTPPGVEVPSLQRRMPVCVVPAMVPALQFDDWQWVALALAAPVVLWGVWIFHKATWDNLRHRAVTMGTLVSMGTLAAFGRSVWALFFGTAGRPGMRHGFDLALTRGDVSSMIYLESAAGVTAFVLIG